MGQGAIGLQHESGDVGFLTKTPDVSRCHAAVALNRSRSAIDDHCLPGAKSLLHQEQASLRNVFGFSESANRQTAAHALIHVRPYGKGRPSGRCGDEHEQDRHFAHTTLRKENRIRLRRGDCHGKVISQVQTKTAVWLKRHRRQAHARMTNYASQSAL